MSAFDLPDLLDLPKLPRYLRQVTAEISDVVSQAGFPLAQPASRLARAPGKLLRPSLVYAVTVAEQLQITEEIVRLGAAVELVHLGSLVHDDIIDQATTRRAQPTINATEGPTIAVLVGDYLFASAGRLAAKVSGAAAELIGATITELCQGEAREAAMRYQISDSTEEAWQILQQKTSSLLAAAAQLTVLDSPRRVDYQRFGHHFGNTFQLIDDALDFISAPGLLGKPTGTDAREGMYTLPVQLTLQTPQQSAVVKLLKMKTQIDAPKLTDMLIASGGLSASLATASREAQTASQAIRPLAPLLAALPAAYVDWAMQTLVAPQYRAILSQ